MRKHIQAAWDWITEPFQLIVFMFLVYFCSSIYAYAHGKLLVACMYGAYTLGLAFVAGVVRGRTLQLRREEHLRRIREGDFDGLSELYGNKKNKKDKKG